MRGHVTPRTCVTSSAKRLMPDASFPISGAAPWKSAVALVAVSLVSVGSVLWLADLHPASPFALLVLLLGLPAAVWLLQRPLASTVAAVLGLGLIVETGEGIGIGEAAYALYFSTFLITWTTREVVRGGLILETTTDKAVFLFLAGATLSMVWAPLFGTPVGASLKEWYTLMMLAIYFPVRKACTRHRSAIPLLMSALLCVVIFVAIRNMLDYQAVLARAIHSYQIGRGRVLMNDCLLMSASTMVLVWAVFARAWRPRLLLLVCYGLCLIALVVTQSRTFWATHALAAGLLFVLAPSTQKKRMLVSAVAGMLAIFAAGTLLAGENFATIAFTMVNRLLTIQKAVGGDISFLSRFAEAEGALRMIQFNPVLGHGLASKFWFDDILSHATIYTNFVHIGYVGLWFTFGLWGVVLILTAWIGALVGGIRAYFSTGAEAATRVAGLGSALCLSVLLLSNFTSPVFELDDTIFMMGLLIAFSSGAWQRARVSPSPPPAST